ncbi:MAG: biotin--[acetyl-CoA-carboxylase] ligase [Oscillospiraceae bacterium]|nr:biotin--[acetyl-CoA-carboxylase] ligase [Oscillospiraceae bacterium]
MSENLSQRIIAQLAPEAKGVRLHLFESVTSTNDMLKLAAEEGAAEGHVFLAKQQTAGKGRQGRSFYSPPMTGLYLSVLYRPEIAPAEALALTPMAAVAAAKAIEQTRREPVQIKWVNDLLLHGRKICGILAESKFSSHGTLDYVIVGIGINLLMPQNGFPEEIRDIAGAVYPADADAEQVFTDTAAALISHLAREYGGLPEKQYLADYRKRLCVLGKTVTVCENGMERQAAALDVDDDLRLLVQYESGERQWRSTGEIRIRL